MKSRFFLLFLLNDRGIRIRIQIHTSDYWIRTHEAQKHVDPVDLDPEHWLNSGAGGYKTERRKGGPSQSASHHCNAEATPLVRNKNKNKKPITPVHCEQYTILHFPTIRSVVHCLSNQHLQYRQRLSFLDYERSHFVIMFQHLHNICVRPGMSCWLMNISL